MSTDEERRERRLQEMERQAAAITPGEEWIYRAQDKGRSQRVRVIGQERMVSTIQMEVEFLDGERTGRRRLVGLQRLKAPWSEVGEYDARDRKLRRIEGSYRGYRPECGAASEAVRFLVPQEAAGWSDSHADGFIVRDRELLASLCQEPFGDLVAEDDSMEVEGDLIVGADSFIRIAKAACSAQSDALAEPLLLRDRREILRPPAKSDWGAEMAEYATDLLHQWSGIPRFTTRLHLVALENEAAWQRSLVGAAVDTLRRCGAKAVATNLERLSREGPPDEETPAEEDPSGDEPDWYGIGTWP